MQMGFFVSSRKAGSIWTQVELLQQWGQQQVVLQQVADSSRAAARLAAAGAAALG